MNGQSPVDVCRREHMRQAHAKCNRKYMYTWNIYSFGNFWDESKFEMYVQIVVKSICSVFLQPMYGILFCAMSVTSKQQPTRQSAVFSVRHYHSFVCLSPLFSLPLSLELARFILPNTKNILLGKMLETMTVIIAKNLKINFNFSFIRLAKETQWAQKNTNDIKAMLPKRIV